MTPQQLRDRAQELEDVAEELYSEGKPFESEAKYAEASKVRELASSLENIPSEGRKVVEKQLNTTLEEACEMDSFMIQFGASLYHEGMVKGADYVCQLVSSVRTRLYNHAISEQQALEFLGNIVDEFKAK